MNSLFHFDSLGYGFGVVREEFEVGFDGHYELIWRDLVKVIPVLHVFVAGILPRGIS